MLGVKWAPVNTPVARRLQTLAACTWFITVAFGGLLGWAFLLYLAMYTRFWWVPLAYVSWIYYDRHTCENGSRSWKFMRGARMWRSFRDYFPTTLVKTAELDPKRNYLLCSYPHGILGAGAFSAFATDALDIADVFPGMTPHIVTLSQHFQSPFLRELAMGLGSISSSERSLVNVLSDPRGGRMPILLVGGAAESLMSRPNKYHIILKRRRGFCRIALQQGVPLVPVFSFGENKLYDQVDNPRGSFLFRLQEYLRGKIGLAPVIPIGRGFFQYSFGLVPRRTPVAVVVGAPIPVERVEHPTNQQISELRDKFEDALSKLFETHKHTYHPGEDIQLVID